MLHQNTPIVIQSTCIFTSAPTHEYLFNPPITSYESWPLDILPHSPWQGGIQINILALFHASKRVSIAKIFLLAGFEWQNYLMFMLFTRQVSPFTLPVRAVYTLRVKCVLFPTYGIRYTQIDTISNRSLIFCISTHSINSLMGILNPWLCLKSQPQRPCQFTV